MLSVSTMHLNARSILWYWLSGVSPALSSPKSPTRPRTLANPGIADGHVDRFSAPIRFVGGVDRIECNRGEFFVQLVLLERANERTKLGLAPDSEKFVGQKC